MWKTKDFKANFRFSLHRCQIRTYLDTLVWLFWGLRGHPCSLLPPLPPQVPTVVLRTPPVCKVNHSDSAVHQREGGSQLVHRTVSDSVTKKQHYIFNNLLEKSNGGFKETYSDSLKLELVVEEFKNWDILVEWRELSGENTLKTGRQVVLPPHLPQTEHAVFAAQKLHARGEERGVSSKMTAFSTGTVRRVLRVVTCSFFMLRDLSSNDACCLSDSFISASLKFVSDTFCTHTWMYFLWPNQMFQVSNCVSRGPLTLQYKMTQSLRIIK